MESFVKIIHDRRSAAFLSIRYYGERTASLRTRIRLIDIFILACASGGAAYNFIKLLSPCSEIILQILLFLSALASLYKFIFQPSQDLYRVSDLHKCYSKLYEQTNSLNHSIRIGSRDAVSLCSDLGKIQDEFIRLASQDDPIWIEDRRKKLEEETRTIHPLTDE